MSPAVTNDRLGLPVMRTINQLTILISCTLVLIDWKICFGYGSSIQEKILDLKNTSITLMRSIHLP